MRTNARILFLPHINRGQVQIGEWTQRSLGMTLWRHNMAFELWWFICCWNEQAVEQRVALLVIYVAMTLMWRQCHQRIHVQVKSTILLHKQWYGYSCVNAQQSCVVSYFSTYLSLEKASFCVSNYRRLVCLLNRLFRRRSKKTSKPLVTGLHVGNPPVTGWFPSQRASDEENVSI